MDEYTGTSTGRYRALSAGRRRRHVCPPSGVCGRCERAIEAEQDRLEEPDPEFEALAERWADREPDW